MPRDFAEIGLLNLTMTAAATLQDGTAALTLDPGLAPALTQRAARGMR
jgi:hypothetical protein